MPVIQDTANGVENAFVRCFSHGCLHIRTVGAKPARKADLITYDENGNETVFALDGFLDLEKVANDNHIFRVGDQRATSVPKGKCLVQPFYETAFYFKDGERRVLRNLRMMTSKDGAYDPLLWTAIDVGRKLMNCVTKTDVVSAGEPVQFKYDDGRVYLDMNMFEVIAKECEAFRKKMVLFEVPLKDVKCSDDDLYRIKGRIVNSFTDDEKHNSLRNTLCRMYTNQELCFYINEHVYNTKGEGKYGIMLGANPDSIYGLAAWMCDATYQRHDVGCASSDKRHPLFRTMLVMCHEQDKDVLEEFFSEAVRNEARRVKYWNNNKPGAKDQNTKYQHHHH